MAISKEVSAGLAGIVIIVLFLVLPISSQRVMDIDKECPNVVLGSPCAPENITYNQRPLIVTLTENEELVPPKATNEIIRNIALAVIVGGGYFYASTSEPKKNNKNSTKKHKSKKKHITD